MKKIKLEVVSEDPLGLQTKCGQMPRQKSGSIHTLPLACIIAGPCMEICHLEHEYKKVLG